MACFKVSKSPSLLEMIARIIALFMIPIFAVSVGQFLPVWITVVVLLLSPVFWLKILADLSQCIINHN